MDNNMTTLKLDTNVPFLWVTQQVFDYYFEQIKIIMLGIGHFSMRSCKTYKSICYDLYNKLSPQNHE